jgi:hypothetical protein
VSPQPVLASEKLAKRDGDPPMLIALVSRTKCSRVAQYIAPQFDKFFQAVETLDEPVRRRSWNRACAFYDAKAS